LGLVPSASIAQAIKEGGGIEPLCQLLRRGNPSAKVRAATTLGELAHASAHHGAHHAILSPQVRAATTLGELALRAGAALDVAKAGAISSFVSWLVDPSLGQPEVAAAALSDIALDNPDTQAQIAEEGAIEPLVAMIAQGTRANALFTRPLAGAVVGVGVGAGTAHPAFLPLPIPAPALASEPPEPVPPLSPPVVPPLALTTSVVASATGVVASATGVVASAAGFGAEEIGVPVLTGASPIEAGAVVGVMAGAVAGIDEAGVVAGAVAGIDESGVETGVVAGAELPTPRLATSQTESSMRSPQRSPRAGQPPRSPRAPRSPRQPRSAQPTSSSRVAGARMEGGALALQAPTQAPPQAVYTVLSTPPTSTQVAAALKLSNVAAGALATLAKGHPVNAITISEEGGLLPLIELLAPGASKECRGVPLRASECL